jgi:hypothetical protein
MHFLKPFIYKWLFNLSPAYRGSGARVMNISDDFHEVKIQLKLSWKTKNHMGMIWGGSLYSALDPMYGVMLHKILGDKFHVVDKSAAIQFKRPGLQDLYAHFKIDKEEIEKIKHKLKGNCKLDRVYTIDLKDKNDVVYASCEKMVHIRHKKFEAAKC